MGNSIKFFLSTETSDYTPVSTSISLDLTNNRLQCVNITIVDDELSDNGETFTVTLMTTDQSVTLSPNDVKVTIMDDEGNILH